MNSELKAKWTAALRSGDYQQGQGELCDEAGYMCCLGVLCRVGNARITAGQTLPALENYRQVGMSSHDAIDFASRQEVPLAAMNDGGDSFTTIADYIDANL